MIKKFIPGATSRLAFINHDETYGRHVLDRWVKSIDTKVAVDLGCGHGYDLLVVKKNHPSSHLIGIDFGDWNKEKLTGVGIAKKTLNIEKDPLPFEANSVDLIICNQVLEHVKEIYWINHEIFRVLKLGGYLYLGVPNILSFHNRLLSFFGVHPTQAKMISAHIRTYSIGDTSQFYTTIGGEFLKVLKVSGSQFYPFPTPISRPLARAFPGSAFSIFFLIQKVADYHREFLDWPAKASLETNYFVGHS